MAILDGKLDVTTQEGYDIACALRGPDMSALATLKKVLTGRLRNLMGVLSRDSSVYMPGAPGSYDVKAAQKEWEGFSEWLAGIEDPLIQHRVRDTISHWAWHLVVAYRAVLVVYRAVLKTEHTEEVELLLAIARAFPGEGVTKTLEAYADYIKEQYDRD